VYAVAVSKNGKFIASGGVDRTIKLWDAATGNELFTMSGHSEPISTLAFTPDGKFLVSACERQIKIWDTSNGKEVRQVAEPGPQNRIPLLTVNDDGTKIVAWVQNTYIEVYTLADGKQVKSKPVHERKVTCLAFSNDGAWAALGSQDGSIRIWDIAKEARSPDFDLPAHQEAVNDVLFTPDRKRIVTAAQDGQLRVWELAALKPDKSEPKQSVQAHKQRIRGLAMSPDGKSFATASYDNTVKLWDIDTLKELRSWDFKMPVIPGTSGDPEVRPFVRSLVFSHDSKHIITANSNGALYVLDVP
jgi:WD40 repeat protein